MRAANCATGRWGSIYREKWSPSVYSIHTFKKVDVCIKKKDKWSDKWINQWLNIYIYTRIYTYICKYTYTYVDVIIIYRFLISDLSCCHRQGDPDLWHLDLSTVGPKGVSTVGRLLDGFAISQRIADGFRSWTWGNRKTIAPSILCFFLLKQVWMAISPK